MDFIDGNQPKEIEENNEINSTEDMGEYAEVSENIENENTEEGFTLPEGAVSEEEIVDINFWRGITLPEIKQKKKKKSKASFVVTAVMSVIFLLAGFGIACVSARGQGVLSNIVTGGKHMTFSLPVSDKPSDSTNLKDENGKYTAEEIAEYCSPSVVSLEVYTDSSKLIPTGQGSGIIMSEDGYIVSNAHVVDGATAIKAILNDESEYAAELIGSDTKTDIAVLKISAKNLTPAEFGNSDDVNVGEEVVTIGSPAGYRNSVTKGIVSGLNRKIRVENSSTGVNCIQIDAPVNPGNSGGALFNMWGQVIGITSSKLASVDYEGLGFAISTNEAKDVIEQLIEYGAVEGRVKIGINYYVISETTAEMYDVKAGLCVASIDKECDIANTELQQSDIITEIDGVDVTTCDDIPSLINQKQAGDEITCHVYRAATDTEDEKEFDITFKLMEDSGSITEE